MPSKAWWAMMSPSPAWGRDNERNFFTPPAYRFLMARIDLVKTIETVTFPDEVWEWLDLVGEIIITTQEEALQHDLVGDFIGDTQYKTILVRAINRDI